MLLASLLNLAYFLFIFRTKCFSGVFASYPSLLLQIKSQSIKSFSKAQVSSTGKKEKIKTLFCKHLLYWKFFNNRLA
jgi:hypothetical protein